MSEYVRIGVAVACATAISFGNPAFAQSNLKSSKSAVSDMFFAPDPGSMMDRNKATSMSKAIAEAFGTVNIPDRQLKLITQGQIIRECGGTPTSQGKEIPFIPTPSDAVQWLVTKVVGFFFKRFEKKLNQKLAKYSSTTSDKAFLLKAKPDGSIVKPKRSGTKDRSGTFSLYSGRSVDDGPELGVRCFRFTEMIREKKGKDTLPDRAGMDFIGLIERDKDDPFALRIRPLFLSYNEALSQSEEVIRKVPIQGSQGTDGKPRMRTFKDKKYSMSLRLKMSAKWREDNIVKSDPDAIDTPILSISFFESDLKANGVLNWNFITDPKLASKAKGIKVPMPASSKDKVGIYGANSVDATIQLTESGLSPKVWKQISKWLKKNGKDKQKELTKELTDLASSALGVDD